MTISAQRRHQGLLGLSTSTRIAGTIISSKEAGVLYWTKFVLGFLRRSRHKVTGIQGIGTQIALQRIFIGTETAIMP